jgi:ribosome-binding ATPase YchF (GTP1/OBG family)
MFKVDKNTLFKIINENPFVLTTNPDHVINCISENSEFFNINIDDYIKLCIKYPNLITRCLKNNLEHISIISKLRNVKESELGNEDNEYVKQVKEYAKLENARVVSLCAKVEEELSELSPEDKQEMLEGLGLDGSGLDKLITATYDILGLATYFTVGKDEVRAWTFKKGMNAKQCAGIIHTDFEKGFIRAEVISYEDLIECGSELKVKEAGKARLEGKDYLMQDGDICHFRFNV